MTNITLKDCSTAQLRRIISIRQHIEALESELDSIAGQGPGPRRGRPPGTGKRLGRPPGSGKRRMSAAGRRAIAEAAKKRWAAYRSGKTSETSKPVKKRRKMSVEGRAKIAAAARERWKKAKAAGKTRL